MVDLKPLLRQHIYSHISTPTSTKEATTPTSNIQIKSNRVKTASPISQPSHSPVPPLTYFRGFPIICQTSHRSRFVQFIKSR